MAVQIRHRTVPANGIDFHVAVSGRANDPGVLCLHGFPEGWMSFREVMRELPGRRVCVPDLRGYGETERPRSGYDVWTLTDDVAALIRELGLKRPVLVGHDWGGALAWIFAHRYSELVSHVVIVNCTHPRTLVRAVFQVDHLQPFRIPWVPFFEIPWVPETLIATPVGRLLLRLSFTLREGKPGTMDRGVVDELVARFRSADDTRPPITYYRDMVRTLALPWSHARLYSLYDRPIQVPVTVVWGEKDEALPEAVARKSERDAGRPLDWRRLPGVGHFVSLERPDLLAAEIARVVPARAARPRPAVGV
ncbi:alpha/beta fold hydrolase [Solirubrobacter soli]|uniref:alpha/beta fold hydrolase n=1 Tax=Solirubrobacter soli TaxID=363832 RepID=UPI0003FF48D3|nr:alpha/beta hydrolase [Solirubrobacter soli]